MPEGLLQLEHLMQATKLLQLKKVSLAGYSSIKADTSGKSGRYRDLVRRLLDPIAFANPETDLAIPQCGLRITYGSRDPKSCRCTSQAR
jgi:hypothetical protein